MFVDLPYPGSWGRGFGRDPFAERLSTMLSGRRRVAYLYEAAEPGTFRYRAVNPVETLNSRADSDVRAGWFLAHELADLERVVDRLDALVIVRFSLTPALSSLVARARRHGVRVLLDTDDLVYDPAFVPLLFDALGWDPHDVATWRGWHANMALLGQSLSLAEAAVTTTEPLARQLGQRLPVSVIPNYLHAEQEAYCRELLAAKQATAWRRTGPVTLGYFSGSPTHARDFAVAVPALARLMEDDPDVQLRLVGHLLPLGELAHFSHRIDYVDFMDWILLQRSIAEVEVNLAPLQFHDFTECKSELKFFEAAAVGTWTVASASTPFRSAIRDGETGRLARAHEWDDALREAVDLARDRWRYVDHAEAAAADVYARYGAAVHGPAIEQAVLGTGDRAGAEAGGTGLGR